MNRVEELLAQARARFAETHPASRVLHLRALKSLPGGNSRSQLHFEPFPFYAERGEGCRLIGVDGDVLFDLVNNYTSLIHGHPNSELVEVIARQASRGVALGSPTEAEVELAELLVNRLPSLEQVRFANSGTEAILYALRTARVFTGRSLIAKCEGAYHGGVDETQVSLKSLGALGESVPELGVSEQTARNVVVLPFGDIERTVSAIEENASSLACVLLEPFLGSGGCILADIDWLKAVREVTERTGVLLVFDEIQSLRLGVAGVQGITGVVPDMTVLGKIIGGGFAIGAFGGRADVMGVLDPRSAAFLSHSGTFNANPMSMAAGLVAMERYDEAAVGSLNEAAAILRSRIQHTIERLALPFSMSGYGSIMQIHPLWEPPRSYRDVAVGDGRLSALMFLELLAEGVFTFPRGALNLSTAVDGPDLETIGSAFDRALVSVSSVVDVHQP